MISVLICAGGIFGLTGIAISKTRRHWQLASLIIMIGVVFWRGAGILALFTGHPCVGLAMLFLSVPYTLTAAATIRDGRAST